MLEDLLKLVAESPSSKNFIVIDSNNTVASVKKQLSESMPDHVFVKGMEGNNFFLQNGTVMQNLLEEWNNKKKIKTFINLQYDKFDFVDNSGPATDIFHINGKTIFFKENEILSIAEESPEPISSDNSAFNFQNLIGQFTGGIGQSGSSLMDIVSKLTGGAQNQEQENDNGGTNNSIPSIITGDNEPGTPNTVQRPYFLNANCVDTLEVEKVLDLDVFLSKKPGRHETKPMILKIGWQLEILVFPKSGFTMEGAFMQPLKVTGEEKSDTLKFSLKAKNIGKGELLISVRHRGAEVSYLEVTVDITGSATVTTQSTIKSGDDFTSIPQAPPDLRLLINQQEVDGKIYLNYQLYATKKELGLYYKSYNVQLKTKDVAAFFLKLFDGIDNIPLATKANKENATFIMKSKGAELFRQLFPEEMRKRLWEIKDIIKTVMVDSDEPWIPWEMCCMQPEDFNDTGEEKFFCELFEISRWIPGTNPPGNTVDLLKTAIVTPDDSKLLFTEKEKNELERVVTSLQGTVTEVEASFAELVANFSKGEFSLWHFSGHGTDAGSSNPDDYCLILQNKEKFSPENINLNVRRLGNAKPVIFFNACQAGKPGMGLTGISGWPKKFIDANATAFIGAYWSVSDETAYKFSVKFYESLASGDTIAASVKKARLQIKDTGDPTWLAYTLYANPFARIRK